MKFTAMVKMSQKTLKKRVAQELEALGYSVQVSKGFVYAPGDVPVLLVAHLDTVHRHCVKNLHYSEDKTIISSPEGIGGDDRCGVYIILQVLKTQKCHVLFCEDEEIGCIGAQAFAASEIRPEVNYMIELDRGGTNDAVFYECDNSAFTSFICSFGFREMEETRSDISVLAPYLGIAGVNLSAAYYRQHKINEYVNLVQMQEICAQICQIVRAETNRFPYIRRTPPVYSWNTGHESLFERVLRIEQASVPQQEVDTGLDK